MSTENICHCGTVDEAIERAAELSGRLN